MSWCLWIVCFSLIFIRKTTVSSQGVVQKREVLAAAVGQVGGSAVLGCELLEQEVGRPPLYVIEWVRFGFLLPIFIKFGFYAPRVDPQYVGRVRIQQGASLYIDQLRPEDQGWYECRVLFLDRQDDFQNGTWIHLTVNSPPTFRRTPPPFVEALEGDQLLLSCSAYGNPQPQISWRKNNVVLVDGDTLQVANGTLTIFVVNRTSAGAYTCHATSAEGEITQTVRLLVQGPPVIIVPPENITVNVSQDAFLACQAEAYPVNLTYSWFQEGTNVYHLSHLQSRVHILVDGSLLVQRTTPEDAGKYTCIPSNGVRVPPSASAYITVLYPAYVSHMPSLTYLPIGMQGFIRCYSKANPPLLLVNWTKDGFPLNLHKFPGWYLDEDGAVVIANCNDDVVGIYSCIPYNRYGTMGESAPTQVILKDPPVFEIGPKPEYFQEVGRELIIPCSATGDPLPTTSWQKFGKDTKSAYKVSSNGSLILNPLSKEDHGPWECTASNNVANISAVTTIFVLGTSPHAALNISVLALMNGANVSWEPGFDGGYVQRFSVWYAPLIRRLNRGQHEWMSFPTPIGVTHALLENLRPSTGYQFSVLSQNKLGSGPFSEIVTAYTLSVPETTTQTKVVTEPLVLSSRPRHLWANETKQGVILYWTPPLQQFLPFVNYVLECRRGNGEWEVLDNSVPGHLNQLQVQGLIKDSSYEFRLKAAGENFISEPSNVVNVSTAGIVVYPSRTQVDEVLPQPVLAGIIAGICFLSTAIIFSTLLACIMSRRRTRRQQKQRQDPSVAFSHKKIPPQQNTKGSDSPDSVMKVTLHSATYDSFKNTMNWDEKDISQQSLEMANRNTTESKYTCYESHIGAFAPLEHISRGPDGKFVVHEETEEMQKGKGIFCGFSYAKEGGYCPEFHKQQDENMYSKADPSMLSYENGQDSYLQVSSVSEKGNETWQKQVVFRSKVGYQARKEARSSGYRQGKYFGYGSSSPMEEAKPLCIKNISPVTSVTTLPYASGKELPRQVATIEEDFTESLSSLKESHQKVPSCHNTRVPSPSSLYKRSLMSQCPSQSQTLQPSRSSDAQSTILQYLSLPYFKEMNVDGDSLEEEGSPQTTSSSDIVDDVDAQYSVKEQAAQQSKSPELQTFESSKSMLVMDSSCLEPSSVKHSGGAPLCHGMSCPDHMEQKAIYESSQEKTQSVSLLKPPEHHVGPLRAALPRSLYWPGHRTGSSFQTLLKEKNNEKSNFSTSQPPADVQTDPSLGEHSKEKASHDLFEHQTYERYKHLFSDKIQGHSILRGSPSETFLRASITSQSSGRGSVSFVRPPSLAQSSGSYMSSPIGDSCSSQSGAGSRTSTGDDSKLRTDTSVSVASSRRDTSVDENYEFDTEFTVETEILDALKLYRNGNPRRPVSTIAIQELEKQGLITPQTAYRKACHVGSVDTLNFGLHHSISPPMSAEARCAALKEEFQDYLRHRTRLQHSTLEENDCDEQLEQATLF
ncbi:protein turtle homolog A [Protopterus annectens]|uniref:protein turtle homolog A n=1 Tax=Protopterus annectens TaxID=7888 RepID=UPI001CFA1791|nr:protein turtle homolog A [Protopterus annectens]